jgi:hypothetical protein
MLKRENALLRRGLSLLRRHLPEKRVCPSDLPSQPPQLTNECVLIGNCDVYSIVGTTMEDLYSVYGIDQNHVY